ncbi:MAG TPA: MerR family transcriptional regulator, partial [Polyangia bacterium]|nr:MerR family transcriptional regulator [Polyangia bacterium]
MGEDSNHVSADSLSLLKVGELAKRTGKTVRAVHLYEELGLLSPAVRSKGGFRLYSGKAVKRIDWIQKLQDLGFSLTEIKAFLRDWEESDAAPKAMARVRE